MSVRGSDSSMLALRALTREAVDAPLPAIDWERVEQRVLSAVQQPAAPSFSPSSPLSPSSLPALTIGAPRRPGSAWAVALAAAAVVALVAAPRSSRSSGAIDANRAEGGAAVADSIPREAAESGAQALSFHRAGVVSFTLASESRIEMATSEGPGSMTVTLIRGSIHADVTPRANGEVFAVEVGHTRIAAHGTSFTVSRQGDQAMVEIEHGAVAVGPAGHPGSTQGWLLVGPDRALFSLDGAREARWLGPPEPRPSTASTTMPATPAARIASGPASRVATNEPSVAAKPTPALVAAPAPIAADDKRVAPEASSLVGRQGAATAAILKGLGVCYERQVTALGVRFSIQSALNLTILPNGKVREGVFTPPLSPTLMSCAREAIAAAHFARGETITQINVPIRLSLPDAE